VVPSVDHARRVAAEGADAIVASGTEAGGHVGMVASLPLVPQVVDAVQVPVVAAGGIADGRGFLAALALGAAGVQLGTCLVATPESNASTVFKQRVVDCHDSDTIVTTALTGKPVRTLVTPALREYEAAARSGADREALNRMRRALRERGESRRPEDYAAVAGQICGLVHAIRPTAEIMTSMLEQAAALTQTLASLAQR
jgi:enoyl-[acyl-carrier protein] reductase II